MTSTWHKTFALVGSMSWDELQTRVKQGARKRLDLVRYRSGPVPGTREWNKARLAPGRFFFSPEELPQRVRLLRDHCSREVLAIIEEADELCDHHFRLLGYPAIDFGAEIDWHLDAVHTKRAPLRPWYKIDFLNFAVVGDHKVIWELNRHQHLVTLAKAWALTQEEKYASELVNQWREWQRANPFLRGVNWASTLEVAFRSLSWLWVRFLLADYRAAPSNFEPDLLRGLALNGSYIEHYLSTYFSPNTHLLGEAVALLFIGILCPHLPGAKRWQLLGWSILRREATRQVHNDGVYFEQSLYYHVYALDFFLYARALLARNGMEVPRDYDTTLEKMLDVLRVLSAAGPPHGFGDDDGGRVFNARRNRREHLTDPLAIGSVLLARENLTRATSLTEETIWLFGERAVSAFSARPVSTSLHAACFATAGIYVMASCHPQAQQMVIDAGPLGSGRAGHGHADALSVTVSAGGRHWLIDPGTFTYVTTGKARDRFRGTAAHNTVIIDDLNQATAAGPFAWGSLPEVRAERWLKGETFTLFIGSHTGYSRLPDPVLHRRFVFHLHGDFWFVRDVMEGREPHRCEISWHFAADAQLHDAGGGFVAAVATGEQDVDARLALMHAQDSGLTCELVSGELSDAYGIKQAAPVVRMSGHALLPAESAAVIAPLFSSLYKPGKLSPLPETGRTGSNRVRGYRYDLPRVSKCMIFSTARESWRLGAWKSDAAFIYCKIRDGEVVDFVLCDGSFAQLAGQAVLAHGEKVERLEWHDSRDGARLSASHQAALLSFSPDRFRSHNLAL